MQGCVDAGIAMGFGLVEGFHAQDSCGRMPPEGGLLSNPGNGMVVTAMWMARLWPRRSTAPC